MSRSGKSLPCSCCALLLSQRWHAAQGARVIHGVHKYRMLPFSVLLSIFHSYYKALCEQPAYVVFNGSEGSMTEKAPLVADQVGG